MNDPSRKYSPGFETEVMVTLAEIKGTLTSLIEKHDDSKQRIDDHDKEIAKLKMGQARILGFAGGIAAFVSVAAKVVGL